MCMPAAPVMPAPPPIVAAPAPAPPPLPAPTAQGISNAPTNASVSTSVTRKSKNPLAIPKSDSVSTGLNIPV